MKSPTTQSPRAPTWVSHALIAAASSVLAAALFAACPPGGKSPEPMRGEYFPQPPAILTGMLDTRDEAAMRQHAWLLWAGLTANAAFSRQPVWRTWWPASATLEDSSAAFQFEAPRIFTEDDPDCPERGPADPPADMPARAQAPPLLVVNVLFNDVAHRWIRDQNLHTVAGLTALHDDFNTRALPPELRHVPEFHTGAVALKTVWVLIRSEGMQLPVWDPAVRKGDATDALGYPPEHWIDYVNVLTTPVPDDAADTVSVDSFYHIPLDSQRLVDSINQSLQLSDADRLAFGARVGDVAVLVGMHVATKEITDWVWATFWWHDRPDDGRYGEDRPSEVQGVWRNYLMDVTFDAEFPTEDAGKPNACFNPWLEAKLSGDGGGVNSNCLSCHARARWHPTKTFSPTYFKRGRVLKSDPIFAETVRLDYVWSLSRPRK